MKRFNSLSRALLAGAVVLAVIVSVGMAGMVDVTDYASFSAAIDAIGSTPTTLYIPNQQNVTANKTVPSNVTLYFSQGGSLNISSGVTVTINGDIDASLFQIFSGSGAVVLGSSSAREVYPQWWGAKGNGTDDDFSALQAWADAAADRTAVLPKGTYKINSSPVEFSANTNIVGEDKSSVTITTSNAHTSGLVTLAGGCKLSGVTLDGSNAAGKILYATGSFIVIANNKIVGTGSNGFGIHAYNAASIDIDNNAVEATSGTPNHQIYVSYGSKIRIRDNYVVMNQQTGGSACIRVTSSNYTSIIGNQCFGGNCSVIQTSISGDPQEPNSSGCNSNYMVLNNNVVSNSSGDGISVGTPEGTAAAFDVTATGNTVQGSTDYGMSFTNVINGVIVGNTVMNASTTGIGILDGYNITITGNTLLNNGLGNFVSAGEETAGINVLNGTNSGCHRITITGNTCTDMQSPQTQRWGVMLRSYGYTVMSDIVITNNSLTGNKRGEISYDTLPVRLITFGNLGGTTPPKFNNGGSSAPPTVGVWEQSDIQFNTNATAGGYIGWVCTGAGSGYTTTRANSTAYSVGTWAMWSTGTTVWECTTAGTTAGSAPSIAGKTIGDTVTDGTVVWTMRSSTGATFKTWGAISQ